MVNIQISWKNFIENREIKKNANKTRKKNIEYYDRDSANLLNSCLVIMAKNESEYGAHQNASKVNNSKALYEWIVWKCSTFIVFAYGNIEFERLLSILEIGWSTKKSEQSENFV